MISEKRKLFFRTIFIVFEDEKIKEALNNKRYSSIVGITRNDLNLPNVSRRVKNTVFIDLSLPEEYIFSKFNDTTRNEIRKTEKIQDLKIISEDKNTDVVYGLYKEFEYAQNRVPFPRKDMKDCLVFSAYFKGEIISGMYVDKGQNDLRIRYIFSKRLKVEDSELYKIISNSTRGIVWQICLWGKKNKFLSLDMAIVNLIDQKLSGITKFKMSFGGEIVPEYTYIYRSKVFKFFERLAIMKNDMKKFFHK